MSKKLLTFIFGIILLISILSSVSGYFLPTKDYNQETETIKIDNAFGLFGKVAEYNLTYNTEQCLINCYAEGTAILHEYGKLFSELNFENRKGNEINIKNNKIFILVNESYEEEIIDYEEKCSTSINGTEYCIDEEKGKHKEINYKEVWKEYNFENLEKGNYKWRIEGTKRIGESVDWIASAFGTELKEWAWWDNNWKKKKEITITENSGSTLSNYSTLIYVPYDSDMQTDFDDLRFVNSAENTELGYWIENKTDSNFAWVWVKVPNLTASSNTTVYMYYGNSGATSLSSIKDAFIYYEDFSSDVFSNGWTRSSSSKVSVDTGNGWLVIPNSGTNGDWASYTPDNITSIDSSGIIIEEHTRINGAGGTNYYLGAHEIYYDGTSSTTPIGVFLPDSTPTGWNFYDTWNYNSEGFSGSDNLVWGVLKAKINSSKGTQYFKRDSDGNFTEIQTISKSISRLSGFRFSQTWDIYMTIDWIRVRGYASSEPTYIIGAEPPSTSFTVNLISPVDDYNSTSQTINFNATITPDAINITNQTFSIGSIINTTNITGIESIVFNWTEVLSDGNYSWNVTSCGKRISDDKLFCTTSTNRNLSIDSTLPQIDISAGNGTFDYGILTINHTINYTITDTNLDSCWLNYNETNITIPCTSGTENSTNFTLQYNVYNATIYANDTYGNLNSYFFEWDYRLFENYQVYTSLIYEGLPTTFTANFLTNGTSITVANLSYNGTIYEGTISNHGGNNFTISRTITVPSVSSNYNASVFWNISQNGFYYSLTPFNQTILNLAVDDCSVLTNILYNFTMRDEENNNILNNYVEHNTTAKLNLKIYGYGSSNLIQEFNKTYNDINPFAVCLTSNLSSGEGSFNIDAQIQFTADDYVTRLYHIQNETINSSSFTTNITLRLLNSTNSQAFKVIYRDSSFIPVQDALIKVYKKYISENEYKIVEIPKTDGKGSVSLNLVLNKELYKFEILKYGVILYAFTDMVAICQTPLVSTCEIDLNEVADSIVIPDYEEGEDFLFTILYNNETRTISSQFSIPSGEVAPISLNVSKEDTLGSYVCSDILISNSGTLTCIVPESFGNATINAVLYRSGEFQAKGSIKINQNPSDLYGSVLIMLALFIMITLFGAGISDNPVYTVIFLIVGVILLYALNIIANNGFIGATATILFLVIATILIIIKGARRN